MTQQKSCSLCGLSTCKISMIYHWDDTVSNVWCDVDTLICSVPVPPCGDVCCTVVQLLMICMKLSVQTFFCLFVDFHIKCVKTWSWKLLVQSTLCLSSLSLFLSVDVQECLSLCPPGARHHQWLCRLHHHPHHGSHRLRLGDPLTEVTGPQQVQSESTWKLSLTSSCRAAAYPEYYYTVCISLYSKCNCALMSPCNICFCSRCLW